MEYALFNALKAAATDGRGMQALREATILATGEQYQFKVIGECGKRYAVLFLQRYEPTARILVSDALNVGAPAEQVRGVENHATMHRFACTALNTTCGKPAMLARCSAVTTSVLRGVQHFSQAGEMMMWTMTQTRRKVCDNSTACKTHSQASDVRIDEPEVYD